MEYLDDFRKTLRHIHIIRRATNVPLIDLNNRMIVRISQYVTDACKHITGLFAVWKDFFIFHVPHKMGIS